jgi:hypothetical protein
MSRIITIIALAGRAGAGKDTVAGLLREPIWETHPLAAISVTGFAARLKRALSTIFNLDFESLTREEKEERLDWLGKSPRELMQTLGTEWGRSVHPDLWVRLLERSYFDEPSKHAEVLIITDCRFPNEVAWVRRKGGVVWWVERNGMPLVAAHSSETAIGPMDCDLTIPNFGSKDDLAAKVRLAWAQHRSARGVVA